MTLRRRNLGLGLENFNAGGTDTTVVEAQPEHETMSAQIVELNEAENTMDQTVEHQEEVQEAAAALESFLVTLCSFEEAGGMSPETAAVAAQHVDHILEPVGVEGESVIPSVESFGSTTGRRKATTVSVEGIKEQLIKIWDYIKDLIARIRKQMKDWWLKTWDAAPRLIKRAEAVRAKANDLSSTEKKSEKIKVGSDAAKVAIGDKVPSAQEAMAAIGGIAEKLYGGAYMTAAKDYVESVSAAVAGLRFTNDAEFNTSLDAFKKVKPVTVAGLADDTVPESDKRFGKMGAGLTAKTSKVLPGNKQIIHVIGSTAGMEEDATAGATGGAPADAPAGATGGAPVDGKAMRDYLENSLAKSQYQLVDATAPTTKASGDTEIAVLSREEMIALADGIVELGGMIQKYKSAYAETDKLKNDAVKAGDKAAAESKKAKELAAANTSIASAAIRLLQNAANVVDQPTQKFTSYVISTASAVLTLCDKSLAQYK